MTDAGAPRPARRAVWLERLGLAALLTPFVVAVGRAIATGWAPVGDAAYFTVRSRDVLGGHWPLLGAWSSGSAVVGELVNNLGPLQLDLLAPFTKAPSDILSPYLGTGMGTAAVNAAAVVLVWSATRAVSGPFATALVSIGSTALVATLGLSWLLDARQQFAMVLPFYSLLWLSLAMAAGVGWAVPWGVFVGSLVVQSHFTFGYQTVFALAVGVMGYTAGVVARGDRRWRRVAGRTAAVAALCWVQPLLDQLFGTGNLGRVIALDRGGRGAGYRTGLRLLGDGALTRPWSLGGATRLDLETSMRSVGGISAAGVAAVTVWSSAALLVAAIGWRRRHRLAVACGGASLAALAGALVAAAAIPPSVAGLVSQNYYWLAAVAAFVACAVALGVVSILAPSAVRPALGRPVVAVGAAALVVLAAVGSVPRYPVESVRRMEVEARRVGRSLREQLAERFGAPGFPDVVEVDLSNAFFGNQYPYVVLVELQRAGVEFRFASGSGNLHRFGASRCVAAGRLPRVLLLSGDAAQRPAGARVLASVAGFTPADAREAATLQTYFGDRLRDGSIEVDAARIGGRLGVDELLDRVLTEPRQPARGLAASLDAWRRLGAARVPSSELDRLARWIELEERPSLDNQYVVLHHPGETPGPAGTGATPEGSLRC